MPTDEAVGNFARMGQLGVLPRRTSETIYPAGMTGEQFRRRRHQISQPLLREFRERHADIPPPVPRTGYDFPEEIAARAHVEAARHRDQPGRMVELREIQKRRDAAVGGRPREVHHGRDMADVIATAYQASAYHNLPPERRDALAGAFIRNSLQVMQAQSEGGAPIADFDRAPTMLSAATRALGKDLPPEFAGEISGGLIHGLTSPPSDVARGVALRGIMDLGRNMSPEDREKFRAATTKNVDGGIDLSSYSGSMAALQNAFSLPREQSNLITRKILESYRGVTGKGTESERQFFGQMFGGRMAPAITASRLADRVLDAEPGSEAEGGFLEKFRAKVEVAGMEAKPFEQDARTAEAAMAAGKDFKLIGETILDAVLDLSDKIRAARGVLDGGAPASFPDDNMSHGR
jgi:hypothetical protein